MMHTHTVTHNKRIAYPILVISLCACFLFYKYILQVYPSVITAELMRTFQLTGAGLGNLAATFYYTYTVTQLFVGILLDKYSPRLLTSAAIFISALSVLSFSYAHMLWVAGLARAFMGIGIAFATVAYMKFAAIWFQPRQYAFVSGLLATAAMAGAVFGQAPLSSLVHMLGWRQCLFVVGMLGLVLFGLFGGIVRDAPASVKNTPKTPPISYKDVFQVFKNKQNWLLTFYSGLAFSPVAIFGGLWGNPFLEQAYHLSRINAASLVSLVFIGLGVGSPLLGLLSDRLSCRRNLMFVSTLVSCAAVISVLYWNTMPLWLLMVMLFVFGFGLGAFMLVFPMAKELNSANLTATVIGMVNTSDAVLDAVTEPSIGKLLDLTWDGKMSAGVHYFSLHSYHIALSILPLYLIIAAILLLCVKETLGTHFEIANRGD